MANNQSIITVLSIKDLLVTGKNGIHEGFRRLGIMLGILMTTFVFDDAVEFLVQATSLDASSVVIWFALAALATAGSFYVVAILVRVIGWVVEGFIKPKAKK